MKRGKMLRGILSWLAAGLILSGCLPNPPIRIGFVSDLTGKNANLGVQGRNGAQIAVGEINENQDMLGRRIELLVGDSGGTPENLLPIDRAFIDQGVVALTGHMASWEAVTAYPLIEEKGVVLFSPTASTPELSGKPDHFFRIIPENVRLAGAQVHYALQNELTRAAIVYDADNPSYTRTYAKSFREDYTAHGGSIVAEIGFSHAENVNLKPITEKALAANPQVILIVAAGINTSILAQHIRMEQDSVQIMISNWAYSDETLQNGGRAMDGAMVATFFYQGCQTPAYQAFQQKYVATYGQLPTFAAAMSYESIYFLAEALAQANPQPDRLHEALLEAEEFQGLCDDILMDKNGDALRTIYSLVVRNGKFVLLDEMPANP